MSNKKPRNREHRTRTNPVDANVSVRMLLPRSAYDQMRMLVNTKQLSKADILIAGIEACSHQ